MTPRRMLMIKGDYDRAGGPETLLSGILHTIDRTRYKPSLVVLRKTAGNGADVLSSSDDLVELPWKGLFQARCVANELVRLIDQSEAKLIHTHDMRSNLAAYLMGQSRKVPWIAHVHGWLGKTHRGKFRIYERIDQHIIRRADLVVVGSSVTADEARYYGARRVEIIPNAIMMPDSDVEQPPQTAMRNSLGIGQDRFIVGVLGRLHPGKGQTLLIRAISQLALQLPNIHLLVVGDGPDMQVARDLADSLGLSDRITFTGYHPDALSLLTVMDLVVVPSLKESLPLTALEAMSRKRCLIASRVGDLPRVIEDGKCGYLVNPGDINQLARCISDLANQPELRDRIGQAAHERIKEHYSMQSMSRRLESIYYGLIQTGGYRA